MDFIPGQRWISSAELQMGLGTVLATEHRTVTIVFMATGDTRTYAKQTAPLSRVQFAPGDHVVSHDDVMIQIVSVSEQGGLLTYQGKDENGQAVSLDEGLLNNFIQLNRPNERLFNGQIDHNKWFDLRYQTMQQLNLLTHSELRGLTGCRTSLIPHQLYIAHEVANRYAPRVLLADEVGLGKTIEAGLILHQQLVTERASRVLIVVPESLVHQWLVEMLRRFNLCFSVFDEARCEAINDCDQDENPFQTEQLILCSLEFLVCHSKRCQQAVTGEWDLLVVDEAHHLQWSPQDVSPEYQTIEALAMQTKGVLLLTATPEQLGKNSHFARLRLLDPDRFADLETFLEEEKHYEPIAHAVELLLNGQPLDAQASQTLMATVGEGDNQQLINSVQNASDAAELLSARHALIEHLLDRHGTGRILFRNTRAAIKGFPQRCVMGYPLNLPAAYQHCLLQADDAISEPQYLLSPELLYQSVQPSSAVSWTEIDPRLSWLAEKIKTLKPEKILVITSSAPTAIDIVTVLREQAGIHAALFHEGMSLIDRDRAGAFFADLEYGAQVLVCSEIGSEGRNFQFAHQMILFDLPMNPDLLEQRIGRLDRIGQTQTIHIHIPYLESSAQETMFEWYHQGLDAFEHTCPAGHNVYVQIEKELLQTLHQCDKNTAPLIGQTKTLHRDLNEALHKGRDRLLEYNSCRSVVAFALRDQAIKLDENTSLPKYMEAAFDMFGISSEIHSEGCFVVRPTEHVLTRFHGLTEDGMTVTYHREVALANEDVHFLTWEHPLVVDAMDTIMSSELGNTSVSAIKYKGAKAGTLLLDCRYVIEMAANQQLQSSRFLPLTIIRILIDEEGRDHSMNLSHAYTHQTQIPIDTATAFKVIQAKDSLLRSLLPKCDLSAQDQSAEIIQTSYDQIKQTMTTEIDRLKALGQTNPNVREEEIVFLVRQLEGLIHMLTSAEPRLDAVKVMVVV